MNPILMSIVLIVGLAVFGRTMFKKIQLLMALESTDRGNLIKERLKSLMVLAIGQQRLVGRKKSGLQASCTRSYSGVFVCC